MPQGLILGPLLFLIYVKDIKFLHLHGTATLFADDTSVFYITDSIEVLFLKSETDKFTLENWLSANRLSLNLKKSVYTIFTKPSFYYIIPKELKFNYSVIQKVASVKFLGLIVDEHLTWHKHILAVCEKIAPISGILKRLKRSLPISCLLNVYYAFMHSHLMYNYVIYLRT